MSKRQQTPTKVAAKAAKSATKPNASSKAKPAKPSRKETPAAKAKKPVPAAAGRTPKKSAAKKPVANLRKAAGSTGKSAAAAGKAAVSKAGKSLKKVVKPAVKTATSAGKAAVQKASKAIKPAVKSAAKVIKPAAQSAIKAVKPMVKEAAKAVKPEPFAQKTGAGVKTAVKIVDSVRKIAAEVVKPAIKAATELVDSAVHAATAPIAEVARVTPPATRPPVPTAKGGKKAVVQVVSEPIAPAKPPVVSAEIPVSAKSGALYYDSHMHTPLCKHAIGEPEEYAEQGIKAGLKGIIFTCHCPMPDGYWPTVRMADSEFDTYVSIVQRAAEAYRGRIDVLLGIESEYFPGHEKWLESLHQRADFHFVLGGLHWQSKDYLGKFETGTIENFRRTYFEHLAVSAETGLYDCLAHPDLVKNYHPDSWCFAIVKNTAAAALDRIAKTGVAMEINTSGLNKSYSEMNPGLEMLRMMAERKIPIVIGSDAHKPQRVGEHFVTALNHLTEVGYEQVSYFKRRERIDLKISDVLASIKKAADANA